MILEVVQDFLFTAHVFLLLFLLGVLVLFGLFSSWLSLDLGALAVVLRVLILLLVELILIQLTALTQVTLIVGKYFETSYAPLLDEGLLL